MGNNQSSPPEEQGRTQDGSTTSSHEVKAEEAPVANDDESPSASNNNKKSSSSSFSFQQAQTILAAYDKDGNRQLDAQEIAQALEDYQKHQNNNNNHDDSTPNTNRPLSAALRALRHYDQNADGTLQAQELERLHGDIDTSETILRYLAFCGSVSTVGKIVRAIHAADNAKHQQQTSHNGNHTNSPNKLGPATSHSQHANIVRVRQFWNRIRGGLVKTSWRVTYAYVLLDTLWEGYKAYSFTPMSRGNSNDNNNNNTVQNKYDLTARTMASRALFNAAMVGTSMVTVKAVVHGTYRIVPVHWLRLGGVAPPWVLPVTAAAVAVVQIPAHWAAPPVKQGLRYVFFGLSSS